MFATLFTKINTTLTAVTELSKIYDYPVTKIEGFPCAVFYPVSFENTFLTTVENLKGYQFKIFIVTETKVKGMELAFNPILSEAVDAVIQQFDNDWDQGAVSGHRLWWRLSAGDWYTVEETQNSVMAVAELNLIINITTNNS